MFSKNINKKRKTKIPDKLQWPGMLISILIIVSIILFNKDITETTQQINIAIAVTTFWSSVFIAFTIMTSIEYNEYNIEQQNKIALYEIRLALIKDINEYFYYHKLLNFNNIFELIDKDARIQEKIILAFSDNIAKQLEVLLENMQIKRKAISDKITRCEGVNQEESNELLIEITNMKNIIVKESKLVE